MEDKNELIEDKKEGQKEERKGLFTTVDNATYLNCYCCQLNMGLVFTYIYIAVSTLMNVVNRIIFHNYGFHFNIIFSFLQQFISLILFTVAGTRNKVFIKEAGTISFKDFYKYKFHYISFAMIFIFNIIFNFYSNQLVASVSMHSSLRKTNAIVLFLIDYFYGKKKFSFLTVVSIFFICGGSVLVSLDSYTNDKYGYVVVFANNMMSILYTKYSEMFKKFTGVSSLKLLVYNSYITNPILILGVIASGEYKQFYEYLTNGGKNLEGTYFGLAFYIFLSCCGVFVLTSSFFISNEKNSSLITNLLTTAKTIMISTILHFFDSKRNKMNIRIMAGLVMTTLGSVFITGKTLFSNLRFGKKDKKEKDPKATELVNVPDNDNEKK